MERVLQVVTDMNLGGIEALIMNYYRKMSRNDVQFDFLMHRAKPSFFDEEILSLGGRIYRLPPIYPQTFLKYRQELNRFFKEHSYRVVHAHNNAYSMFVLREAQRHGVPVRIASSHCAFPKLGLIQQVTYNYCRSKINRYCTKRFACSIPAGQWLYSGETFDILSNAIDAEHFFFSQQRRESCRSQMGIEDNFVIAHVGRFTYPKNHSFLLDTFAKVLERESRSKLMLIGDGELRRELEKKATQLLPKEAVIFLGIRDDVPALLQAADVFVFPSHFEGLPVTLIEAQAAGLPCIKSENVTDEAVVTDLVTSLPLGDPKMWAEAILKTRGTPRRDQTRAIIDSGYDIHTAVKKLEYFYLNGEPL